MVEITDLRQSRNFILASLTDTDLHRVAAHLSRRVLKHHEVLKEPGQPLETVHFVEEGMISLLTISSAEAFQVETAIVGSEGMCGMEAFHHVSVAGDRAVVQAPGYGYTMASSTLTTLSEELPSLRHALHRFAFAIYSLATHASACNRRHTAEQRMARWLLLAQDRIASDTLPLTHLFLAQMLGVRRSTITVVAEQLRAAGIIDYTRGKVTIRDREALERLSCDCYRAIVRMFGTANVPTRLKKVA